MIVRYRIVGGYWPCAKDGFRQLRHPRRRSKYRFAMILQEWRRQQWTPDVSIRKV